MGNKIGSMVCQSLNILVVDDEVNIRKTVSVCQETEGHKVIAVFNIKTEIYHA
jgi:DNA-binding response OmpR family regulator